MKTKQEVIKEAWGEYYEIVKDKLNTNGWCIDYKYTLFSELKIYDNDERFDFVHNGEWDYCEVEKYRPKSLQGIENNNGWIKGTPKKDGNYKLYSEKLGEDIWSVSINNEIEMDVIVRCYTHYKEIKESKKPLY